MRDPAKHDEAFLSSFLATADLLVSGTTHLAERVKAVRKSSALAHKMWQKMCEAEADNVRDPEKHEAKFLVRFLQKVANSTGVCDHPGKHLVTCVKRLQSLCQEAKELWYSLCDEERSGIYDPQKHDSAFLRHFLDKVESSGMYLPDEAIKVLEDREVPPTVGPAQPPSEDLVARVKRAEGFSSKAKDLWHDVCDKEGGGSYDPRRHSDAFLLQFLELLGDEGVPVPEAPQRDKRWQALVERVIDVRRRSQRGRERWQRLCDAEAGGLRDPKVHGSNFLQRFLAEHEKEVGSDSL